MAARSYPRVMLQPTLYTPNIVKTVARRVIPTYSGLGHPALGARGGANWPRELEERIASPTNPTRKAKNAADRNHRGSRKPIAAPVRSRALMMMSGLASPPVVESRAK